MEFLSFKKCRFNYRAKCVREIVIFYKMAFFSDLSDLAVYGVLSAIEGCDAFEDLMNNTKVGPWFRAVKDACAHSQGQSIFQ